MRLTLILSDPEARALRKVAADEDRPPRDQVRRIVRGFLRDAGALPPERPAADAGQIATLEAVK